MQGTLILRSDWLNISFLNRQALINCKGTIPRRKEILVMATSSIFANIKITEPDKIEVSSPKRRLRENETAAFFNP